MTTRQAAQALLAAATLALALTPDVQAAKPVQVRCGETITGDTRLANDLIDCPNNGIVIGADDITLDLNGHTVDGVGIQESCPDDPPCAGIANKVGHVGLTVEDGTVQEFEAGVFIEGGRGHRVRRLAVSRNGDGILLFLAKASEVTANSLDENAFGIFAGRSDNIRIARNSVSEFAEFGGCGIEVSRSERVLVADNAVLASEPGAAVVGDTCGICVCFGAAHNRIERNAVSGNGFVGVLLGFGEESNHNELADNHIFWNRDGMILVGDTNTISRNRVVDAVGADDGSGFGIVLESGQDNLITSNTIEGTAEAGIWVAPPEVELPPVGNALRLNQVREAGADGILVESTAADTLLDRNLAEGAGDDGIDVESPATTLRRNTADSNHDFGIEAVLGVTDGGGNKARGNGNPLQCTNVFCK
jgi:nitrous oxidase accessory protein NosD